MPTWNEILKEIAGQPNAFDLIRRNHLKDLSEKTQRNVIVYYSGWLQKGNLAKHGFRFDIVDSDKMGFMSTVNGLDRKKGLDLVLHTPGGSIGATESIVHYLKSIFGNNIRAIIPQIAMSAGTMIACSCKEIVMGKHSNLGPIDPQINGKPTHGIIEEFNKAKKEIAANPKSIPVWQTILSKYSPTLIGECEKAIKWSESMVSDWLKTNMFAKDSKADQKANAIITELGSHAMTLSHDRHLAPDQLKGLGLNIADLESDQDLQDKVLSLHHSCIITLTQTPAYKLIENQDSKAFIQLIK
ncbi:MAG: S49 family peptidase [Bacteroidetes bacterium]|jgi:ATP-dependent protease ClpP protease subunit|nr:S49 family peptidase [Bacteroidota bacterium]